MDFKAQENVCSDCIRTTKECPDRNKEVVVCSDKKGKTIEHS